MPVTVSFAVEAGGKLPTGQPLGEAITQVDAETDQAPLYYGINCDRPSYLAELFDNNLPWVERVRCIRAKADQTSLDKPDRYTLEELGDHFRDLVREHPHFNILGGCRGTDIHYVEAICLATLPLLWMHLSRDSLNLLDSYSLAIANY